MFKLANGNEFPRIGFGTFRIHGEQLIYNVIDAALKAGYRAFDTAAVYRNEHDIGKALIDLLPKYKLNRSDIYITTKLSPQDQGGERAKRAVQKSLDNLQVSYIDCYLIHWPGVSGLGAESPENSKLRRESWHALVELHKKGILKNIGVSNYTVDHLKELLKDCLGVPPAVNQVEFHPKHKEKELFEFCKANNILLQAYCSIGGTSAAILLNDPIVREIAKSHNKTSAQVLLQWALQKGVPVIPKSVTVERIIENIDLNFELSANDMERLDSIKECEKFCWDPNIVT